MLDKIIRGKIIRGQIIGSHIIRDQIIRCVPLVAGSGRARGRLAK